MSNILILLHQTIIDKNKPHAVVCFYESIANELSSNGNNVKILNLALCKDYHSDNLSFLDGITKNVLFEDIKNFNPDLIFTYNNQIFKEIFKITNCPICVFDADSVELFPNKEYIKLHSERYYLFTCSPGWEDCKYEQIGFKKDNIGQINFATSIKNVKLEKDKNISFIGTNFLPISNYILDEFGKNVYLSKKELYDILIKFWQTEKYNTQELKEKYLSYYNDTELYSFWDTRLIVLNSLLDLGLNLYGKFWDKLPNYFFQLKLAFNETPMYSLLHNQNIYNSSHINLSISHPQCNGYTYPWRIYDIMASNGLLITSYSELLKKQIKNFVDIPMYENPYDARELCKYALGNPSYCEDIISKSNEFIEKFGRWKDNLKIIQDITGVILINEQKKQDSCFHIYDIEIKKKKNNELKIRLKNIFNGISLILSQIPILEYFYTKKLRAKLYSSINKYKTK